MEFTNARMRYLYEFWKKKEDGDSAQWVVADID